MLSSDESIVLVTPVWNDSARLRVFGFELAEALRKSDLPVRWVVADDGSESLEQVVLKGLVAELREVYASVEVMLCDVRSFKGGAVYRAWDSFPDAKWLAFVDADGAIDAASTIRMLHQAVSQNTEGAVIGVRQRDVKRAWMRKFSFSCFKRLVQMLIGIQYQDTQCGAKVVSGEAYRTVAARLEERGYIFDAELILALEKANFPIEEFPIPWKEISGSKMQLSRDGWKMLKGLLRIRRRARKDGYSKP